MAFEFKLPDIGEGISEGEIVKWLVSQGDSVKEDQPVLEIMTDKATVEIATPRAGTVGQLSAKEGESVKVGSVIMLIDDGAAASASTPVSAPAASPAAATSAAPVASSARSVAPQASAPAVASAARAGGAVAASVSSATGPVLASPATRKLARENDLDLRSVVASGPHGRVLKEDVERAIAGSTLPSQANTPAAIPMRPLTPSGGEERIPLRGIRKKIAENMQRSKQKAAHFAHIDEGDMTELVRVRELLKEKAAAQGVKLTYLPFIVKALCAALKEFPKLNAMLDEDKQEIVIKHYYNIGIGVATADDDLIVPVIKNADQKGIIELAREIASLAEKARTNKLSPSDLQGGTFTITSLGNMAGSFATPVINFPEVGILGFYKIEDRVVVRNGQMVIRKMANASISLDHRLVDGAMGARFMKSFLAYLEQPASLLL